MSDDLITQPHSSEDDVNLSNEFGGARTAPIPYEAKTEVVAPPKSCCWRWFCCCCAPKPPPSSHSHTPVVPPASTGSGPPTPGPGSASVSSGAGTSTPTPAPATTASTTTSTTSSSSTSSTSSGSSSSGSTSSSSSGGGLASLVTQVQQPGAGGAPVPVMPPRGSVGAKPAATETASGIKFLLPPLAPEERHKKTLVLDLDETLVHSSFKPIPDPDFVISIELDGVVHRVYVRKRPGVDNFLRAVGDKYEVVIFTASLAKYADPLLDILDRHRTVKARLFREACVQHYGNYVKDLTHLGRQIEQTIIIDNSPFSYMFQPDNAIPISSWFSDKSDRQLYDLLPFLDSLMPVDDVATVLVRHKLTFNPPV